MPDEPENPFAPPLEEAAARKPNAQAEFRAALRSDTPGKRLAGWCFMANAAVSIVALFATDLRVGILGIGLDLLVGFLLFSGYGSATALALPRIAYATLSGPVGFVAFVVTDRVLPSAYD